MRYRTESSSCLDIEVLNELFHPDCSAEHLPPADWTVNQLRSVLTPGTDEVTLLTLEDRRAEPLVTDRTAGQPLLHLAQSSPELQQSLPQQSLHHSTNR